MMNLGIYFTDGFITEGYQFSGVIMSGTGITDGPRIVEIEYENITGGMTTSGIAEISTTAPIWKEYRFISGSAILEGTVETSVTCNITNIGESLASNIIRSPLSYTFESITPPYQYAPTITQVPQEFHAHIFPVQLTTDGPLFGISTNIYNITADPLPQTAHIQHALAKSEDEGITWTRVTNYTNYLSREVNKIKIIDNEIVVIGREYIIDSTYHWFVMTSPDDGVTWTDKTWTTWNEYVYEGIRDVAVIKDVAYFNDNIIIIGHRLDISSMYSNTHLQVMVSNDGGLTFSYAHNLGTTEDQDLIVDEVSGTVELGDAGDYAHTPVWVVRVNELGKEIHYYHAAYPNPDAYSMWVTGYDAYRTFSLDGLTSTGNFGEYIPDYSYNYPGLTYNTQPQIDMFHQRPWENSELQSWSTWNTYSVTSLRRNIPTQYNTYNKELDTYFNGICVDQGVNGFALTSPWSLALAPYLAHIPLLTGDTYAPNIYSWMIPYKYTDEDGRISWKVIDRTEYVAANGIVYVENNRIINQKAFTQFSNGTFRGTAEITATIPYWKEYSNVTGGIVLSDAATAIVTYIHRESPWEYVAATRKYDWDPVFHPLVEEPNEIYTSNLVIRKTWDGDYPEMSSMNTARHAISIKTPTISIPVFCPAFDFYQAQRVNWPNLYEVYRMMYISDNIPWPTGLTNEKISTDIAPGFKPAWALYNDNVIMPSQHSAFDGSVAGTLFDNNTLPSTKLTNADFGETSKIYYFNGAYYKSSTNIPTDLSLWTGVRETDLIIAQDGCVSSAAQLCKDYSVTNNAVVYDDWFLPCQYSLHAMYQKLHRNGIGGFDSNHYWSSSQGTGPTYAWEINFTNGHFFQIEKSWEIHVRACRVFTSTTLYKTGDIGPAGGWIFFAHFGTYMEAAPVDQSVASTWDWFDGHAGTEIVPSPTYTATTSFGKSKDLITWNESPYTFYPPLPEISTAIASAKTGENTYLSYRFLNSTIGEATDTHKGIAMLEYDSGAGYFQNAGDWSNYMSYGIYSMIYGLAYSDTLTRFVCCGENGVVYVSPLASNPNGYWILRPTGVTVDLKAIAISGTHIVAISDSTIIRSEDSGETWIVQYTSSLYCFNNISTDGIYFYVSGHTIASPMQGIILRNTIANADVCNITLVKDIYTGATGSMGSCFITSMNGALYFAANNGTSGVELWKSDGTSNGTVLVKDIYTGATGSNPTYIVTMGLYVYFAATNGTSGVELWRSDGTNAGTTLVKDIYVGATGSSPQYLAVMNGALYFAANNGTSGVELWKSDGTDAGTVIVKDIYVGGTNSSPDFLYAVGNTLYFGANNGTGGKELWKSNGTDAGTVMVKDVNPTGNSYPGFPSTNMCAMNGILYFSATNGTNGYELWRSNGTDAGTTLVKDILAGASSAYPSYLCTIGNWLYFTVTNGNTSGVKLWRSDGTDAGTTLIKDISSVAFNAPTFLIAMNDILYFDAADTVNGAELWRSDGTEAGTYMVENINPSGSAYISYPCVMNNTLYFAANNGTVGAELFLYKAGWERVPYAIPVCNTIKEIEMKNTGQGLATTDSTTILQTTDGWETGTDSIIGETPDNVVIADIEHLFGTDAQAEAWAYNLEPRSMVLTISTATMIAGTNNFIPDETVIMSYPDDTYTYEATCIVARDGQQYSYVFVTCQTGEAPEGYIRRATGIDGVYSTVAHGSNCPYNVISAAISDSGIIVAMCYDIDVNENPIFVSDDNGVTWTCATSFVMEVDEVNNYAQGRWVSWLDGNAEIFMAFAGSSTTGTLSVSYDGLEWYQSTIFTGEDLAAWSPPVYYDAIHAWIFPVKGLGDTVEGRAWHPPLATMITTTGWDFTKATIKAGEIPVDPFDSGYDFTKYVIANDEIHAIYEIDLLRGWTLFYLLEQMVKGSENLQLTYVGKCASLSISRLGSDTGLLTSGEAARALHHTPPVTGEPPIELSYNAMVVIAMIVAIRGGMQLSQHVQGHITFTFLPTGGGLTFGLCLDPEEIFNPKISDCRPVPAFSGTSYQIPYIVDSDIREYVNVAIENGCTPIKAGYGLMPGRLVGPESNLGMHRGTTASYILMAKKTTRTNVANTAILLQKMRPPIRGAAVGKQSTIYGLAIESAYYAENKNPTTYLAQFFGKTGMRFSGSAGHTFVAILSSLMVITLSGSANTSCDAVFIIEENTNISNQSASVLYTPEQIIEDLSILNETSDSIRAKLVSISEEIISADDSSSLIGQLAIENNTLISIQDIVIITSKAHIESETLFENVIDAVNVPAFKDYFLPSKDELAAMYTELAAYDVGNFTTGSYWSSSEVNNWDKEAHSQSFDTGVAEETTKSTSLAVRACRSFYSPVTSYNVRDIGPAGGLIFSANPSTHVYYEAATQDQTSSVWSNITTKITSYEGIGIGKANSDAIIAQVGHVTSQAYTCEQISTVDSAGMSTLGQWFEPSESELQYIDSIDIPGTWHNDWYWSIGSSYGWAGGCGIWSFTGHYGAAAPKQDSYRFMAMRAFSSLTSYAINNTGPAGGWIVYKLGGLYLEVTKTRVGTAPWCNILNQDIGNPTQSTALGTGVINTICIENQIGHTGSAAKICTNLVTPPPIPVTHREENTLIDTSSAGILQTFGDWFLPSKDELGLMYTELKANSVGGFTSNNYWSSTETSNTQASSQNFNTGTQTNVNKTNTYYVRSCRAFYSTTSYAVRDTGPASGLIFYKSGNNYMEAAPADQSAACAWSNINNILITTNDRGNYNGVGSGLAITNTVILQSNDSVAGRCGDYSVTINNRVFDDWFAPTFDDIMYIYTNVNGIYQNNIWTCSEAAASAVRNVDAGGGAWNAKTNHNYVFAIRAFSSYIPYTLLSTGPGGGYVFYADSGLYMEITKAMLGTHRNWSSNTTQSIGTIIQPTNVGSGVINTIAITNQKDHTASAAKLCKDYSIQMAV